MINIPVAEFASRLDAERTALRAFVSLLETEQLALIGGDVEQLLALSDGKARAVQQLSQLAQARKDELLAHGVEIGDGAVRAWLRTNVAGAVPLWEEILKLAEQLQYLNRTNGMLLQTKLRHNQQALTVLHNAANSAHGLYGADGQPRLSSAGRILGSV